MTLLRPFAILGSLAAYLLCVLPAAAATGPTVDTPAGKLQGTVEGGLEVFKGVPFAVPPVGARRWKPPAPLPRWSGVKKATDFGPACVQPHSDQKSVYWRGPMPMSEDCLTLNIWAPAHAEKAPVFVWIYGGALWNGASREPMYDGSALAKRGIVVVSINYRLGVLGWLAHPGLSAESPDGISGNYGLLDQIRALNWVKKNIDAFGGDAANVTIAGESAGALSVMYLMTAPQARGLFAKAIVESGYMVTTPALKEERHGMPAAEQAGAAFARSVGAADIAALRAMDPETLTDAAAAAHFLPFGAVDGHVLPEQMVTAFDEGHQAHVPVLAGFNQGEIRSLRMLAPPVPDSAAVYEKTIRARYGDLADDFLALYPASDLAESVIETTRDALYGWTAERLVRKQTALGIPSYLYLFDHGYPAEEEAGLHAFHASELPYVFGTADKVGPYWPKIPSTPDEQALSRAMTDYWASFATTGTPTADDAPAWPPYDGDAAYMHFTDAPHPATDLMPGMYELNEAVMCRRLAAGDVAWNWNVGMVSPPLPPKAPGCD